MTLAPSRRMSRRWFKGEVPTLSQSLSLVRERAPSQPTRCVPLACEPLVKWIVMLLLATWLISWTVWFHFEVAIL
jgi:hypothetical protein